MSKSKLEKCYQNLYQAEAAGNKKLADMWRKIIAKLENTKKN